MSFTNGQAQLEISSMLTSCGGCFSKLSKYSDGPLGMSVTEAILHSKSLEKSERRFDQLVHRYGGLGWKCTLNTKNVVACTSDILKSI